MHCHPVFVIHAARAIRAALSAARESAWFSMSICAATALCFACREAELARILGG
jgi:O-acetyl-ADP-ribose deacetylase (regulator of RNase III)